MAPSLILQRRPKVPAEESTAFGPIAERFRRAGDLDRAVSLCRDGLQRFPHHISARVTLGWALLDLGKYDEARTELELVLRRAPDNLAAIRGLAELHDRSEHTLHLPMDGPGQWPPDEEAVDQAATEDPIRVAVDDGPVADVELIRDEPAAFTPTDLSVDLWSSASPDEPVVMAETLAEPLAVLATPTEPAASEATAFEETAVADATAVDNVTPEPWIDTVAAHQVPVEPEVEVAAQLEAELSALESLEVVSESPAAQWDEAPEVSAVTETPVVSETDIAALIAEADRLEAEAESEAAEAALVLEASPDTDPMDDAELELAAPGLHLVETSPRPAAEVIPEVISDVAPDEVAPEVSPEIAAAVGVEDVAEAIQTAAQAHVADVISMTRVARTEQARSVVALERFLHKVQARRAQLMAQSVA